MNTDSTACGCTPRCKVKLSLPENQRRIMPLVGNIYVTFCRGQNIRATGVYIEIFRVKRCRNGHKYIGTDQELAQLLTFG